MTRVQMAQLMLLSDLDARAKLRVIWFRRTGEIWPHNPKVGDLVVPELGDT